VGRRTNGGGVLGSELPLKPERPQVAVTLGAGVVPAGDRRGTGGGGRAADPGHDPGRRCMTTRVWDYRLEYAAEREDILDAVDTVFRSGRLILGESVHGFEEEFAAYHGVPHAVSCDNGTNALVLALRALDVKPGDEVVTVSNTAAPTVVAINQVGAVPVFVDVDRSTYLMDVARVRGAITERTRCLLPVHLYGQCVDMGPLRDQAETHGLAVLGGLCAGPRRPAPRPDRRLDG
jgi:DegT/DnrJ/EryC1/StrS aminotransferase family protein